MEKGFPPSRCALRRAGSTFALRASAGKRRRLVTNLGPMSLTKSTPATLLDLIGAAPADRTAIIIPEQNIRVSYGSLRTQVQGVANQLAAAGVRRGDRVGMALTNGLPAIVSFLA